MVTLALLIKLPPSFAAAPIGRKAENRHKKSQERTHLHILTSDIDDKTVDVDFGKYRNKLIIWIGDKSAVINKKQLFDWLRDDRSI